MDENRIRKLLFILSVLFLIVSVVATAYINISLTSASQTPSIAKSPHSGTTGIVKIRITKPVLTGGIVSFRIISNKEGGG